MLIFSGLPQENRSNSTCELVANVFLNLKIWRNPFFSRKIRFIQVYTDYEETELISFYTKHVLSKQGYKNPFLGVS